MLLVMAALLPSALCYSCGTPLRGRRAVVASRVPAVVAGWPWEQRSSESDDAGKFVRHSELQPGGAPLGMITAGLGDDELEALA